ncbi:3216_t:CDS:2 [Funneliformis mosseae]|uniref:3216_t:CDS:1 n=1 Tax=Funneliformis mosseae TaxID=27381 RepID=A0A9N9G6Q8_FUNMO|nr:3216_t:CDS:2 [Funneliformis mosseae]
MYLMLRIFTQYYIIIGIPCKGKVNKVPEKRTQEESPSTSNSLGLECNPEHFSEGTEANEHTNFYIAPENKIKDLGQILIKGHHIFIEGYRQSDKTTSFPGKITLAKLKLILLEKYNQIPFKGFEVCHLLKSRQLYSVKIYVATFNVGLDAKNGTGSPQTSLGWFSAMDLTLIRKYTIENLAIQHIFVQQALNAINNPSEYAFQAEFATVLKYLLSNVYPVLQYRIIVEAKERDVNGNRRKRLDIFLRDHDQPTYGFELVVNANKKNFDEHLDRANYYSNVPCT